VARLLQCEMKITFFFFLLLEFRCNSSLVSRVSICFDVAGNADRAANRSLITSYLLYTGPVSIRSLLRHFSSSRLVCGESFSISSNSVVAKLFSLLSFIFLLLFFVCTFLLCGPILSPFNSSQVSPSLDPTLYVTYTKI
jgi:hypothetical protein